MPKRGPDREVSDEQVLMEFLFAPDDAGLFTSEIAANLPLSRQRVRDILEDMEQDEGYITSKTASGRRLWWLTPKGRKHVTQFARDEFF